MSVHLNIAVDKLCRDLTALAAAVEQQLAKANDALMRRNADLAQLVIDDDRQIDLIEIDIEEECLKILSLYQPVAFDLRLVISALKMNDALERIGDYAANIAERAKFLASLPPPAQLLDFETMCARVLEMLSLTISAFTKADAAEARRVCSSDRVIDEMHASHYRRIGEFIVAEPARAFDIIQQLSVSRYFERIADLATNIAEDVIYLAEGKIVRHSSEKRLSEKRR